MKATFDMEPEVPAEELYLSLSFQGATLQAKLQHAKQLFDRQESEVFRLRTELKRSETLIKKLQETAALQSQNQNNTSSAFALPSEFKQSWEDLQGELMDTFEEFLEEHWLMVWLVRDVTQLVYTHVLENLDLRLTTLTAVFMLDESQKEHIKKTFSRLFQDNCGKMLAITESQFSELRLNFERKAKAYVPEDQWNKLVNTVEQGAFRTFIEHWLKLCLHMIFSEPRLTLTFTDYLDYSVLTKPEDVFVIDGFPKGNPKCVVVLPPPFRSGSPYLGLKPAVLILTPDQEELQSEEQQKLRSEELHKLKSEDEESLEPASPLVSEPIPCNHTAHLDAQPESEDDEGPGTPNSFRQSKQSTYTQKYEQKINLSRSPYARKQTPAKEASPKEVMALYQHFKTLRKNDGKPKPESHPTEEEEPANRYSTMPLQVQKPSNTRNEKAMKIDIVSTGQLTSTRKSFDETPSSTQRFRKEGLCPNCRAKLPCHRCEGLRAETYSKPSRAHSSSMLEEKEGGNKTTLMKKRLETTNRAFRQNEAMRPKEACKVM
jgi:hypothetical protein